LWLFTFLCFFNFLHCLAKWPISPQL
jgi:hypothetical protein